MTAMVRRICCLSYMILSDSRRSAVGEGGAEALPEIVLHEDSLPISKGTEKHG